MNIIVRTASGRVHVRPDNTLDRYSRDFYVPDGIDTVSVSPVLFARITRPGKCVGKKFAQRYYEGIGFGVLVYPEDLASEGPEGFADAIRLDQSSSLPDASIGEKIGSVTLKAGEGLKTFEDSGVEDLIAEAISAVSVLTLVRTGDLVAVELSSRACVWKRGKGDVRIKAENVEKVILDFSLI